MDYLDRLAEEMNYDYTENSAVTHRTTGSDVFDLFALGGAYRQRNTPDCINLFKNAYEENEELALKCLFYLRDCRDGQGERRFFRICFKWLCNAHPEAAKRNLEYIAEYGRWDDLIYSTLDTKLENYAIFLIKEQLKLDVESKTPSLLAKWMPSENTSSHTTRTTANKLRKYLKMSHKGYRKMLSKLRERINIVERLMSANRWDEIEFDKIPSKAGLIYKNAFARRDLIAQKYREFAKDTEKEVNAKVLYPYDVIHKALACREKDYQATDRLMIQKYWDNLPDLYEGRKENGLCIVDTSGSMDGQPIEVALSLGAYIAERGFGPFANHFITFSSEPELIRFDGIDITDKMQRARRASWEMNTNLKAVFNLLLKVAKENHAKQEEIPERLYIISDMEFDGCLTEDWFERTSEKKVNTLLENIAIEWKTEGYDLPQLIFWNVNARNNNIPMLKGARFAYISGFSPIMLKQILTGKDGYDLMIAKLVESGRYDKIK